MCSHSGKQSASARPAKVRFSEPPRRANRCQPEPGQAQRVARHSKGRQHVVAQARPCIGKRLEQRAPRLAVPPQIGRRAVDRTLQQHRAAVIQRVREWSFRMHPLKTVRRQRKLLEARRTHCQRVHRGADIVDKSRERQLRRTRTAADRLSPFIYCDRMTRARQYDRGGKTIRSRPDNHGAGACGIRQLRYCRRDAEETAWQ